MKEKPFYQCEHCIYYTPYYNICVERVWRVSCGYCDFRKRSIKPSLRNCKYFDIFTEEEKLIKQQEIINNYQKHIYDELHRIERGVKCLNLYLNKDKDLQKLDICILEDIKKT